MAQEYTLGRGKVHFSRFRPGTTVPEGFRYIGNTPEFSLTIEAQNLDHFSSDEGIREKDDSVPLEVNRTGSMTTDNIHVENVSLFFFGDASTVTQAAVAAAPEVITDVKKGHAYKLGSSPSNPAGVFGIDATGLAAELVVGATALVLGVDFTVDLDAGIVTFPETGTVVTEGDDVEITFAVRASTRSRVISGSQPVEGAMMYVTKNPKGADCTYYLPYVKITPNGDYALKGDEWQQIPLSLEVLKLENVEAIYRDNVPVYA